MAFSWLVSHESFLTLGLCTVYDWWALASNPWWCGYYNQHHFLRQTNITWKYADHISPIYLFPFSPLWFSLEYGKLSYRIDKLVSTATRLFAHHTLSPGRDDTHHGTGKCTACEVLPITSSSCKSQGHRTELLLDGKMCDTASGQGCLHHHLLPLRKTHSCSSR